MSQFGTKSLGDQAPAAWANAIEAALGDGNPTQGANYVLFYNSTEGEYQARNGLTGVISFAGTDAAAVFRQARDALPGGGKIVFREGTFVGESKEKIADFPWDLYASFLCTDKIEIRGMGMDKTILKLADGVGGSVIGTHYLNRDYVKICDLTADGNKANNPDTGIDGDLCGAFTGSNSYYFMSNVKAINCQRDGFYLHGGWGHYENLLARLCNGVGIEFDAVDYSDLFNPLVIDCGKRGIGIVGGGTRALTFVTVHGGSVYGCSGYGVWIGQQIGAKIIGTKVRACGTGNTYTRNFCVEDSEDVDLIGVLSVEAYEEAIMIADSKGVSVIGGSARNSSQKAGNFYGARINNSTDCTINGLKIIDDRGVKKDYGILEDGSSDWNLIIGNLVRDLAGNPVNSSGVNTQVEHNIGYP